MPGERCSAEEYINGDDDLHFCFDVSNDQWEQEFFTMVQSAQENDDNDVQSDTEKSDDETVVIAEPKIKSIKEAILSPEEVQYFLNYHMQLCHPSSLSSTIDNLADIYYKKLVQTSLNDFLK